jgi:Tfp pilus assembly protein PilF
LSDAWIALALSHRRQHHWPAARFYLEKALQGDPQDLEARGDLVKVLEKMGQKGAAAEQERLFRQQSQVLESQGRPKRLKHSGLEDLDQLGSQDAP